MNNIFHTLENCINGMPVDTGLMWYTGFEIKGIETVCLVWLSKQISI